MSALHLVTVALLVCLAHTGPDVPDKCEVRRLAYDGSLMDCNALGWMHVAVPYLERRPWLSLRRATCETGDDA